MAAKILIVDDNPHVLKLLRISLEKAGYEIYTAENGDDGLEKANAVQPDLIISDVMMPETDGIEFCWMIRENSKVPMVPFIFLTSLADQESEIRGFRAGADEYLVKPVDRQMLLEKVEALLKRANRLKEMDNEVTTPVKGFEGNLADLSTVEVIQLLNMNKRNGTLYISSDESGRFVFKNGELFHATLGKKEGVDAVNAVVRLKSGIFKFVPKIENVPKNVTGSTMNLLLDALRIMDESNLNSDN
ncbi:MAG: response regulator transcription factor [Calditrichia bacterium]